MAEDWQRSEATMKRICALLLLSGVAIAVPQTPLETIDKFFSDFTTQWISGNPNTAAATRYFTGTEQGRLERQLTPETEAYRRERIALARKGRAKLGKFDRTKMSEIQRVSADLMDWQLDTIIREEPYLDYSFPLNQFNGTNVNVIETMTVRRPLSNERDAENYVAALGQVGPRMEEAVGEAKRLVSKNMIPPRFIIQATLAQMKQFIAAE